VSARVDRIVVAEDELFVREGIRRVLESIEDVEVVAVVGDLPELERAVEYALPDVVITDIRLPPTFTDEGIRFAADLWLREPGIGVVVLSQHVDPSYATTLFDRGAQARAYVPKERVTDRAELARVIRTVAEGGSHVDVRVVEELLGAAARRSSPTFAALTPREREILRLIAEAKSNVAIARELGVTTRAVERHVSGIFSKMQIEDSPEVSRRVRAALAYLSGSPDL
jgi:DNA-binding NarL/FixJ family response regulator